MVLGFFFFLAVVVPRLFPLVRGSRKSLDSSWKTALRSCACSRKIEISGLTA